MVPPGYLSANIRLSTPRQRHASHYTDPRHRHDEKGMAQPPGPRREADADEGATRSPGAQLQPVWSQRLDAGDSLSQSARAGDYIARNVEEYPLAALLVAGAMLSAYETSALGIGVALYLIGLGWNFCFVTGSALLAKNLEPGIRVRFQGTADVLVWLCAGTSTLGGGFLIGMYDYPAVGLIGGLAAAAIDTASWSLTASCPTKSRSRPASQAIETWSSPRRSSSSSMPRSVAYTGES